MSFLIILHYTVLRAFNHAAVRQSMDRAHS
jgi:hypothetical protein